MKKNSVLVLFISSLLLIGCSANSRDSKSNAIASLFESAMKESQASDSAIVSKSSAINTEPFSLGESEAISSDITSETKPLDAPVYEKIDIDLTTMNATMVYSEVLNMQEEPSSYVGKIVKMSGPFKPYESTDPSICYPAIIIQDATACCASGIEFILYGVPLCSMEGGNGYPLYLEEATIVGRFETYLEASYLYIHLVDAIWLK